MFSRAKTVSNWSAISSAGMSVASGLSTVTVSQFQSMGLLAAPAEVFLVVPQNQLVRYFDAEAPG